MHMDNKPNGVVKSNTVVKPNGNPRLSEGAESNNYEAKECTVENPVVEHVHEKQDVLGVKSTNFGTEGKNEKTEDQKSTDNKKLSSPASKSASVGNTRAHHATSKTDANDIGNVNSTPSPNATKDSEVTAILE